MRPRSLARKAVLLPSLRALEIAVAAAVCGACGGTGAIDETTASIVYDSDDRLEIDDAPKSAQAQARSVAALVVGDPALVWQAGSWASLDDLCPDVRFAEQPAAASCTAALVGSDLLLTAGHCARLPCNSVSAVFGFQYDEGVAVAAPTPPAAADVYRCKEVLAQALPSELGLRDYAWFRLDRPVAGRRPLRVSSTAEPISGAVWGLGFDGGVPMKFHGGGHVLDSDLDRLETFRTDLDLFAGNSGAPIFDATDLLVGVASAGGADFGVVAGADCRSAVIGDTRGEGERATYAFRAVAELCSVTSNDSQLCARRPTGCVIAVPGPARPAWALVLLTLLGALLSRRALRERGSRNYGTSARVDLISEPWTRLVGSDDRRVSVGARGWHGSLAVRRGPA